ncbi:MAG: hypothetical protein QOJ40_1496 [Verrucomicrobiota bacterium]
MLASPLLHQPITPLPQWFPGAAIQALVAEPDHVVNSLIRFPFGRLPDVFGPPVGQLKAMVVRKRWLNPSAGKKFNRESACNQRQNTKRKIHHEFELATRMPLKKCETVCRWAASPPVQGASDRSTMVYITCQNAGTL